MSKVEPAVCDKTAMALLCWGQQGAGKTEDAILNARLGLQEGPVSTTTSQLELGSYGAPCVRKILMLARKR